MPLSMTDKFYTLDENCMLGMVIDRQDSTLVKFEMLVI